MKIYCRVPATHGHRSPPPLTFISGVNCKTCASSPFPCRIHLPHSRRGRRPDPTHTSDHRLSHGPRSPSRNRRRVFVVRNYLFTCVQRRRCQRLIGTTCACCCLTRCRSYFIRLACASARAHTIVEPMNSPFTETMRT